MAGAINAKVGGRARRGKWGPLPARSEGNACVWQTGHPQKRSLASCHMRFRYWCGAITHTRCAAQRHARVSVRLASYSNIQSLLQLHFAAK
jgi:hypothetical protein